MKGVFFEEKSRIQYFLPVVTNVLKMCFWTPVNKESDMHWPYSQSYEVLNKKLYIA